MNPKKLKALKIINIIIFTVAVVLFDVGAYQCIFTAVFYDGSGSLTKNSALFYTAVAFGVPTIILLVLFFVIKHIIKKHNKQDC